MTLKSGSWIVKAQIHITTWLTANHTHRMFTHKPGTSCHEKGQRTCLARHSCCLSACWNVYILKQVIMCEIINIYYNIHYKKSVP